MDLISRNLEKYVESYSDSEPDLLKKINKYTHLNVHSPRMLSGHVQGRILSFLSRIINPNLILEIGTYTGYSALCLSEGLSSSGKIITIDKDASLEKKVQSFFNESKKNKQIEYLIGDATKIVPSLEYEYDLVFIDADEKNYLNYFEMVLPKLRTNGIIIVDNVLWSGKVIDIEKLKNDKLTKIMHNFNETIKKDKRISKIILPIRDGITLIKKMDKKLIFFLALLFSIIYLKFLN